MVVLGVGAMFYERGAPVSQAGEGWLAHRAGTDRALNPEP